MVLEEVENILGGQRNLSIKLRSQMDLVDLAHKGVNKIALNHLVKYLDISQKRMATILKITPKTIQARKPKDNFPITISEQILRIAEVAARGLEVFGDDEKFRRWLHLPNVALGKKTPFDLLDTNYGTDLVLDVLGRIEHGVHS